MQGLDMVTPDLTQLAANALDVLDETVVIVDATGQIALTNRSWRNFAYKNRLTDGTLPRNVDIGSNYLTICKASSGLSSAGGLVAYHGICSVLDGRAKTFSLEYPCHSPEVKRWFFMNVKPLRRGGNRWAVISHSDITQRWIAQETSERQKAKLDHALNRLQDMARLIKTSLNTKPLAGATVRGDVIREFEDSIGPNVHKIRSFDTLSKREAEVLHGLVRGERAGAIATRLSLSVKSVSTYRARILEKLGVTNNAELTTLAVREGIA